MYITLSIFIMALFILFIITILYINKGIGKWFYHDILGWHMPYTSGKYKCTFDGLSLKTLCKHCGKEIIQDSQGNWF